MARLFRPHIPIEVRCRVVMRQLGEMWPDLAIENNRGALRGLLDIDLGRLAGLLGCETKDLRLDHDPALATRQQFKNGRGEVVRYVPAANSPEHLIYREKHAHHIKTNVRGDGAQYPDRVLIKRERRRAKGVDKRARQQKPKKRAKRQRLRSRPLRSANRWPPRGSRKVNWRRQSR